MTDTTTDPLVIFTPSGKRGRFVVGEKALVRERRAHQRAAEGFVALGVETIQIPAPGEHREGRAQQDEGTERAQSHDLPPSKARAVWRTRGSGSFSTTWVRMGRARSGSTACSARTAASRTSA